MPSRITSSTWARIPTVTAAWAAQVSPALSEFFSRSSLGEHVENLALLLNNFINYLAKFKFSSQFVKS
jgi:hypothetical protein